MGVPKQKWTLEEEDALKAGIAKYGPGKWSTILKDPDFVSILHLRSNVDLKDKWRNMNAMASGCGSRHRATRPAKQKTLSTDKLESISSAHKDEHAMEICIENPSTKLAGPLKKKSSKMPMPRLDSLILDTIAKLKESLGSSRAEIAEYIEENHSVPPNLEKVLQNELKALLDCGKLTKVKHRYRLPKSCSYLGVDKNPSSLLPEVKQECATKILTKADIDAELERMWKMTPQQAAAMAVKAVAEAEAAISEAEKAARDAEAAEADAELAKVFAAAAMRALKQTALCT